MGFGEWLGLSKVHNEAVVDVGTKAYLEVPAKQQESVDLNSGAKVDVAFLDNQESFTIANDENITLTEVSDGVPLTSINPFETVSTDEIHAAAPQAESIKAEQSALEALNVVPIEIIEEIEPLVVENSSPEVVAEVANDSDEEDIDVHPEVMASKNIITESAPVVEENKVEDVDAEMRNEKLSQATDFLQRVTVLEDELRDGADSVDIGMKCVDLGKEIREFVLHTEAKFRLQSEINKAIDESYIRLIELARNSR